RAWRQGARRAGAGRAAQLIGGKGAAKMDEAYEVELDNVTRRFGDLTAVDAVTLGIRRGEFLTLLGPSGCGKTTLVRMIAGFATPDSGRVRLGGRDVTDLPPYRRDVTTVFQQYALFPHLNVFDNVAFGLQRRRVARDEIRRRVGDALEMVRLSGLDERTPAELSGGQQQRVAIARALVLEPRVLLLDEPLSALDVQSRRVVRGDLRRLLAGLPCTTVYVTHNPTEALVLGETIAVLESGRISQCGSRDDLMRRPRSAFAAEFLGVNLLRGVPIPGEPAGLTRVAVEQGEVLVPHTDPANE